MATTKSVIDTPKNVVQSLSWLEEIIINFHKDSLNIKDEEYDLALRTLKQLKESFNKLEKESKSFGIIKDKLSAKQWQDIWSKL